jgi:cyclase
MPCLLFDGNALVKTTRFGSRHYVGDPINAIKIFNEKEVDELVFLDIGAAIEKRKPAFDRISECASECFMPFSYGGGVASLEDFARLYKLGVEKVIVNSLCLRSASTVAEAVREYGSSSVVASVDYRRNFFGRQSVYSASGQRTNRTLLDHCRFVSGDLGVGEILLTAVDRDGTWGGFDLETIDAIATAVAVPVIASGGAGNVEHIREAFTRTHVNGLAIGSMAVYQKKGMGVLISFPDLRQVIGD